MKTDDQKTLLEDLESPLLDLKEHVGVDVLGQTG